MTTYKAPTTVMFKPVFSFTYDGRPIDHEHPRWKVDFFAEDKEHLHVWTDHETGLVINMRSKALGDAVWWDITLRNDGEIDTPIIKDFWSIQLDLPGNGWREHARVHQLHGSQSKETDWLPFTTELPPGSYTKFAPEHGWSSSGACPFFNVEYGDREGVIIAVGWTGQWRAEVLWGTVTRVRAGMQRLHLCLKPGEQVTLPSIMSLFWKGDIEDAYNMFRRTMLDYVFREYAHVPLAHLTSAAYEWNFSTEEDVLSHARAAHLLGFETAWLDAYYMTGGFPHGIGNYQLPVNSLIDKSRFPKGLGAVGDEVHKMGMDWLVWYSFEMAQPGSWLYEKKPEWLLFKPDKKLGLFNFANDEAREYITEYFIEAVKQNGQDWLRIDCCPGPFDYFKEQKVDWRRIGLLEIRWVEGLYKFLDDLLEACPWLQIDNCDGGGRRIDIQMCARSVPLWRTDYTTPVQELGDWDRGARLQQAMIAGLSRYVPLHSCGVFHEKPYWFRSALCGGVGVLADCRDEFYHGAIMSAALKEAKRIRPYFSADMHLLTPVTTDPDTWHVVQYHRPHTDSGIILAFRREQCQKGEFRLLPKQIDMDATYIYTVYKNSYGVSDHGEMGGHILSDHLIHTVAPGSILIEYQKKVSDDDNAA